MLTHKITNPDILATLSQLHQDAGGDKYSLFKNIPKLLLGKLSPEDLKSAYLAISPAQGEFIYDLLLQSQAKHIVEFGTSFGISTLYLAAAAQQTSGQVITTELVTEKCTIAQQNFNQAKVNDLVELRQGDALVSLANIADGIDFLLLDGWNNLYLPLLKLLEPKLKPGAIIYADNANFPGMKPFVDYVRRQPEIFSSSSMKTSKGKIELIRYQAAL
ncbi:O-methyltransferase [Shewanella sp.]|uniref:O-methyltransferase n=1 Tax=Shewanella sp. TaxID=50422 RepID=UPI004054174C